MEIKYRNQDGSPATPPQDHDPDGQLVGVEGASIQGHRAYVETPKMDKERIAELRAKLDALGRTNFAEPFEGWIGLATELLDALEAALARAEGAEAERDLFRKETVALAKDVVTLAVVPEYPESALCREGEKMQAAIEGGLDEMVAVQAMALAITEWFRAHIHTATEPRP